MSNGIEHHYGLVVTFCVVRRRHHEPEHNRIITHEWSPRADFASAQPAVPIEQVTREVECRMSAKHDRVWFYTGVAWVALVLIPVAYAAVQWERGIDRDVDMTGVGELIGFLLFILSVPMAALAFGVFAPLGIALDVMLKGRTSRVVNVLLGAVSTGPAIFATVWVTGWPGHSLPDVITAFRHSPDRAPQIVAATLMAGMIVGLGLRHRGSQTSATKPLRR